MHGIVTVCFYSSGPVQVSPYKCTRAFLQQKLHHGLAKSELATLFLASLESHLRSFIVDGRYKDLCKNLDLYVE